jgi:hypothetical protein
VFVVTGPAVAISGLTVADGAADGSGFNSAGGGINNQGQMTITDCVISGNTSTTVGGGIENTGTLTVTNSTISGSSAGGMIGIGGGGIWIGGPLTVTGSTFSGDSTGGRRRRPLRLRQQFLWRKCIRRELHLQRQLRNERRRDQLGSSGGRTSGTPRRRNWTRPGSGAVGGWPRRDWAGGGLRRVRVLAGFKYQLLAAVGAGAAAALPAYLAGPWVAGLLSGAAAFISSVTVVSGEKGTPTG